MKNLNVVLLAVSLYTKVEIQLSRGIIEVLELGHSRFKGSSSST